MTRRSINEEVNTVYNTTISDDKGHAERYSIYKPLDLISTSEDFIIYGRPNHFASMLIW